MVPPRRQQRAEETSPQQHGEGGAGAEGVEEKARRQLEKAALAALGLEDSDEEAEPCRASGAGRTQQAPLPAPAHDAAERAAGAPSAGAGLAAREQARGAKAAAPSAAAAGPKAGKDCKHPHPRSASGLSARDIEALIRKKQEEEAQSRKQKREEKGASKLATSAGAPHKTVRDSKELNPAKGAAGEVAATSPAGRKHAENTRKHAGYAKDGLQQPTAAAAATNAAAAAARAADGKADSARVGKKPKATSNFRVACPNSMCGVLLLPHGQDAKHNCPACGHKISLSHLVQSACSPRSVEVELEQNGLSVLLPKNADRLISDLPGGKTKASTQILRHIVQSPKLRDALLERVTAVNSRKQAEIHTEEARSTNEQEDTPHTLVLSGRVSHQASCLGVYLRDDSKVVNGSPVWRKVGSNFHLAKCSSGMWLVQMEEYVGVSDKAHIKLVESVLVSKPWHESACTWQEYRDEGAEWIGMPWFRVIADPSPPKRLALTGRVKHRSECLGLFVLTERRVNGWPVWQHASEDALMARHTDGTFMVQREADVGANDVSLMRLVDQYVVYPLESTESWEEYHSSCWSKTKAKCLADPKAPASLSFSGKVQHQKDCLGRYVLVPQRKVNGMPCWKHSNEDRWIVKGAEFGWLVQRNDEVGASNVSCMRLNDRGCLFPHLSSNWQELDPSNDAFVQVQVAISDQHALDETSAAIFTDWMVAEGTAVLLHLCFSASVQEQGTDSILQPDSAFGLVENAFQWLYSGIKHSSRSQRVSCVEIRGVEGPKADLVNGIFVPVEGETYAGRPVYEKKGDEKAWIEYCYSEKCWHVTSKDKKGTASSWMQGPSEDGRGTQSVEEVSGRRWSAWNAGTKKWENQIRVVIAPVDSEEIWRLKQAAARVVEVIVSSVPEWAIPNSVRQQACIRLLEKARLLHKESGLDMNPFTNSFLFPTALTENFSRRRNAQNRKWSLLAMAITSNSSLLLSSVLASMPELHLNRDPVERIGNISHLPIHYACAQPVNLDNSVALEIKPSKIDVARSRCVLGGLCIKVELGSVDRLLELDDCADWLLLPDEPCLFVTLTNAGALSDEIEMAASLEASLVEDPTQNICDQVHFTFSARSSRHGPFMLRGISKDVKARKIVRVVLSLHDKNSEVLRPKFALENKLAIIRLLMDRGASVKALKSQNMQTPVSVAAKHNQPHEVSEVLLSRMELDDISKSINLAIEEMTQAAISELAMISSYLCKTQRASNEADKIKVNARALIIKLRQSDGQATHGSSIDLGKMLRETFAITFYANLKEALLFCIKNREYRHLVQDIISNLPASADVSDLPILPLIEESPPDMHCLRACLDKQANPNNPDDVGPCPRGSSTRMRVCRAQNGAAVPHHRALCTFVGVV